MFYYALIGLIAAADLLIVNYDILFNRDERQSIPALGTYKKLLYGILLYYTTDIMWGILDSNHMVSWLYFDTVIYYIAMALDVMLWTQYVVKYLAAENIFGRIMSYTGQIFFVVVVAVTAVNFFNPILFWFDDSGTYQAGLARHIQLAFQIVLLFLTSAYAFKAMMQADSAAKIRYRAIFLFGLVVGFMLLIQLQYPLLPLYSIGFMMGTKLIHTFVFKGELERYRQGMLESMQKVEAQEKVSQAKSEFLSNMSHEIRTPINTILGMNEVILRECNDENIINYSENVKIAGNMLLGLVNDILDFSKIESGKIEIISDEYDLSVVLNDVVNMVKQRADEKGLEISLDFDQDIPRVLWGDEVRIRQILSNLLTNAVKYTEKGSVTFSVGFKAVENDEDKVLLCVSVKDTGIGIKPEDMDRLFLKFERMDKRRNRNVEGSGLGLSITQKLLELMGTTLQVESIYGEGSNFFFQLEQNVIDWEPLGDWESYARTLALEHRNYRERFTAPEATILVVDDNPMNLMVFKSLLKQTKVQIDMANDGYEAFSLAKDKKYDMVFLDHMMPGMDGIETLHEMRAEMGGLNIATPIICLTANAIAGAREEYLAAGFTDYLSKPVNSVKLEDMLLAYLPTEKIHEISDEENIWDNTAPAENTEIPEKLAPLQDQDWIDISLGIQNSGDLEAYMPLLEIFYESMDEKANEIEEYYQSGNIKDYTIKVHALKSSARLIGATDFGEEAQKLENAGKAEDMEYIRGHHRDFMEKYRSFKEPLGEVFATQEAEDKPLADAELLEGVIEEIRAAAEDMDGDRLEDIFAEMEEYKIPEAQAELYNKLKAATAQLDYEGILKLLS
ncbi:ATP-binding protein [Anaerovibrio sp. RM50]|uniref:ATP-binding protein n=1 Tax=Anaerovibrio sp. RM50 TaxID=1200557 RepID=UPI000684B7C9|nr:ATP-binding protein [Anaerovibrio sp. RM50]